MSFSCRYQFQYIQDTQFCSCHGFYCGLLVIEGGVELQKKEEEPKKDIRVIVREINNAERNNNSPPVPTGKYSVIYEDPPWE